MDCSLVRSLFDKVLDKRLEDAEINIVKEHLDDCQACHEAFKEYSSFYMSLQIDNPVKAPQAFTNLVMEQVSKVPIASNRVVNGNYKKELVYKQLGLSLVLASVVTVFVTLSPFYTNIMLNERDDSNKPSYLQRVNDNSADIKRTINSFLKEKLYK